MSDNNVTAKSRTIKDYQDLDFGQLRLISDYVMRNSIPVNLTATEIQMVISALMDLMNISVNNLNTLRSLNGEPEMLIPVEVGPDDSVGFDVEPEDWKGWVE